MAATQKAEKAPEFDKAAEAIWNAEFLLVVCGPLYEEGTRPFTNSEYCDPATVSNPNKFMGYWGGIFNECSERTPHEGFNILKSWRDRFFCLEDVRKRQPKKRPEEESDIDRLPRFQAYTRSITGYLSKVGFPSEEIYENCGNIFSWQCSRIPPCCQKVHQVDRAFRFEIEESNQEAQPIKYIQDKREDKPKEFFSVTDSQQEDINHVNEGIAAIALDVKGKDDKGLKRLQRKMDKGQVIKLMPHLQIGHDRFPDRFEGFPTKQKEKPGRPVTWEAGVPDDPKALNPVNINLSSDGGDKKDEKPIPAHLKPVILPCHPPKRASHLLAHVNAIDRDMYHDRVATMYAADPEKWEQERQLYYQQVSKLFRSDHSHSAAMQRAKKITYNISVQFTAADGTPHSGPATSNTQVGSYSTTVLPPRLLDKLLKVGKSVDDDAAANLRKNHVETWEQGKNGLFYFSNVLSRETHQEPINFQHHDNICVWFPLTEKSSDGGGKFGGGLTGGGDADGALTESPSIAPSPSSHIGGAQQDAAEDRVPAVHIPKKGKVSVVVETVLNLAESDAGKENKTNAPPNYGRRQEPKEGEMAPNPCSYTGNTWQLVGTYNPPDFSDVNEFKKNPAKNAIFEYVLEDRRRHVVKIGCLRSDPTAVKYVLVESPCDEETNPTPNVVTTVTRAQKDQPGAGRSSDNFGLTFGSSKPKESTTSPGSSSQDKKKSKLPTPNHQLCPHCHDLARPFVLMTKPGVKDEGFCSQYLAQRTKAYKLWEKQMIDAMKQDNNKSLVLLELGADKKMEPCRAYAEKTFKSLKSSKCTMIRISPHNLETKKKQGAGAEAQNLLQLQSPVIQGLQNIDRLVMEKMRKKGA